MNKGLTLGILGALVGLAGGMITDAKTNETVKKKVSEELDRREAEQKKLEK